MWQNSSTNVETKTFTNKEEVKNFLMYLFAKINTNQEYNIYLHQINDYYDDVNNLNGASVVKHRVESIVKNGFSISKYSALSGTAKLVGDTNTLNIDNVLDYEYYKKLDCVATCVIAIPKYIEIDGVKVEYSSYQGKDSWNFPEQLTREYEKVSRYKPELHHYKCCLFDAIKQHNDLPMCYMLGVLQMENNKNKYSFIQTTAHLSSLGQQEVKEHNEYVRGLVRRLYEKYKTKENEKIIVKSYLEIQPYYETIANSEI